MLMVGPALGQRQAFFPVFQNAHGYTEIATP